MRGLYFSLFARKLERFFKKLIMFEAEEMGAGGWLLAGSWLVVDW
jgi:hypothetical protein